MIFVLFQAFSIFCGMAIHHTAMYEECHKAMARQKVALEVSSGLFRCQFRQELFHSVADRAGCAVNDDTIWTIETIH